jgi:hypothetical protein
MLVLIIPGAFMGCLGMFGIMLSIVALILFLVSFCVDGGPENNIGKILLAMIFFFLSIIINIIAWGMVWVGK